MREKLKIFVKSALARRNKVLIPTMCFLGRSRRLDVMRAEYTNEYVRLSQLELAVHEIETQNVQGDVAEIGVYKGTFAAVLNLALPNRKLYLFDTFEGFSREQEQNDRQRHGLSFERDFSDTSIDVVLRRMKYPDQCIVRKGLFPETAAGLEDCRFCFVSIDADLYQPILAGLEFFYDRLSPGGFIFVHDYNNADFPGARQAVADFSSARMAPFIPVTDVFGTAIFRAPPAPKA